MRVKFTDLAVLDLQEIGEWLLRLRPAHAAVTVRHLRESCESLSLFPEMGSRLPNGARKLVVDRFLVLYRIKGGEEVQILHITPAQKDWRAVLRQRL